MRRLAGLVTAGLVLAPVALGHGPAGGGVGFVSTVGGLEPLVVGVSATVLGGDDRLQLVNYSGKTIVVEGYEGEPFLRFTPNGVYENVRSPATYLSRVRDPTKARVPPSADAEAPPVWRKAREGSTFSWHDHRIHWVGDELPPVLQSAPRESHLIFRWQVPAQADAKPFVISGFLGYRPPPEAPGSGWNWLPVTIAIAGVLLLVAAIGVGARRLRRRAP